jgi:SAM-dependent methyltransferase
MKFFFKKLKIVNNINLNNNLRFKEHKKNLAQKKMLKSCYSDFYIEILKNEKKFEKATQDKSLRIELGSGVGFIKEFDRTIITSDIIFNEFTDKIIDGNHIPYKENEINSIFGIFCFHHFKDPFNFIKDLEVKLKPGGLCILIEPYYGILANFIYKRIHESEYFDEKEDFKLKIQNKTAMEKANQALSYIYFVKNKKKFQENFPNLEVVRTLIFGNYLRFLFSGGLNFRKILPDFFIGPLKFIEKIFMPLKRVFGLHYLIVVRKLDS